MYNFNLINADTDSITINKPDGTPFSEAEQNQLLQELNFNMPEMISWEEDGIFPSVVVVKAKNYVLFDGKKVKTKGSAFRDQKKEPALAEFMNNIVTILLDDASVDKCVDLYNSYVKEAMDIKDISRWSVKKTITDKVMNGERANETKVKDALGTDNFNEGDKVWLYSAIEGEKQDSAKGQLLTYSDGRPKMVENCILKQSKNWTGDENKMHYVQRVYDTVSILETILDINKFTKYHLKKNKQLLLEL
jgi:hypothetical protein